VSPQQLRNGPAIGVGRFLQLRPRGRADALAVRAVLQQQLDGFQPDALPACCIKPAATRKICRADFSSVDVTST
jgi:hypothetical protein